MVREGKDEPFSLALHWHCWGKVKFLFCLLKLFWTIVISKYKQKSTKFINTWKKENHNMEEIYSDVITHLFGIL